MLVSLLDKISSYSFSTFSSAALSEASASFRIPLKAIMRSLSSPNLKISLSRHSWAACSSPVRRHDSSRFSTVIQSSVFSGEEKRETNGDDEIVRGELWRIAGARCDSSRACAGDKWLGGWRSEGAMMDYLTSTIDRSSNQGSEWSEVVAV